MNIHRNNYEEYFLLYADGELSQEDKQAVEGFVLNHPDLAEELQIFVDTKLTPPTHTMPHKYDLLKLETWDADHLTDAQLAMLSHLDGELTPAEQKNLESLMGQDELLRKEWHWMTGLTLEAEAMPMPAKANLVRLSQWNEEALTGEQQAMLEKLEGQLTQEADARLSESIAGDIVLQKEWTVLQKTKLVAEQIAMPGKERLLRRNKDEKAPVIKLNMKRWLAAAAIITGIGWFVFDALQSPAPAGPQVAVATATDTQMPGTEHEAGKSSTANTDPNKGESQLEPQAVKTQNDGIAAVNNDPTAGRAANKVAVNKSQDESSNAQALLAVNNPQETIQLSLTDPIALDSKTGRNTAELLDNPADFSARGMKNPLRSDMTGTSANDAPIASYASYDEPGYEEETINIAGAKVPRQKIRGIIRTVSRTIGRSFDKGNVAPAETSFVSEMK